MNVKKLFACLLLSFAAVNLFGCGKAEEVPQETTTVSQTEIVSDSGDTETEAVTEAELSADDFEYKETENGIEIQKYIGSGAEVKIPGEIDGKPVVKIGGWAFRFSVACHAKHKKLTSKTQKPRLKLPVNDI